MKGNFRYAKVMVINMKTRILFQGDSITDFGRDRKCKEANAGLGNGYVQLIAARLLADHPEMKIYNRGVGGNRIMDMYARWEEDAMRLDFDVLSIFNGINDVGFGLRLHTGASAAKFEKMYDLLLEETMERKPGISLVLCEPFVMKMPKVWEAYGADIYENYDIWNAAVAERADIVRRLADKYHAVFVPLRKVMEDARALAPDEHWSQDCIHPTAAGNELIARAWLTAAAPLLK